jgi:translation initiation factor 2 subunit 2
MTDISEEQAELSAMFGASKKKKKTTTKKTTDAGAEGDAGVAGPSETATAAAATSSSGATVTIKPEEKKADAPFRVYDYEFLLNRVMNLVQQNNPELVEKSRTKMPPPQVQRLGTKKTHWTNFNEICVAMSRHPDHVFQFFMAELGTEGSIDGNKQLIIRGKFAAKYIESLLRKYILEYVSCSMCRSLKTDLRRDNVTRLYFADCLECGCSRSVATIRAGFHAQTRADRRALRNAT